MAEEPVAEEPVAVVDEEPAVAETPVEPEPVVAHRPGEVAETPIALWPDDAADRMRAQWRELQIQFIDDPEAAVASARSPVTNAVNGLARTLLAAQDALDPYQTADRVDTETCGWAIRQYREFLDRVLAL